MPCPDLSENDAKGSRRREGWEMSPTLVGKSAISRARRLRRDMTAGEKRLWVELRSFRSLYGYHLRKQVPIGPYIADFACHGAKLIIELDGEHHQHAERSFRDQIRDEWFAKAGYRVLRFSTGELASSFEGCLEKILMALNESRTAV